MFTSIGIAIAGILIARYFYLVKPTIPVRIGAMFPRCHRVLSNKWYLDEIYDIRLRRRTVQGRRSAAGRVRPQGGGWRRQRRRMVHPLRGDGFGLVGHLGDRWRGAAGILPREDALLPGVHSADRARTGVCFLRRDRGPGVLRLLRRAVTIYGPALTQHHSTDASGRPGGPALHPRQEQRPDPRLGEPGGLCRVSDFAAAGFALPVGPRGVSVRRARRVDTRAGRELPHRPRRHQPVADHAHHADGLHRHTLQLERHPGPRQGILRDVPALADGNDRRISLAGLFPVLRFLGTRAGADVLHHRRMGRPPQALRRHQVLPLYAGGQRADAAGHPDALLRALQTVRVLHL